jgi:NDP-sugar pyrophosphorylase family protein
MKVLITTSGIGSRLGEYTKYTNKSLMRIGAKPAISHIIDNYPSDTNFIITIGYYGDHIKQYLSIAYPQKLFEFVIVDKFEGPGSSLLYSLIKAEGKLQEPFIYHASDTIILNEIPKPEYNWIGGAQGTATSSYASFDTIGNNVTSIYPKGNLKPDFLYTGISGIYDFKEYWKLANQILIEKNYSSDLGDVEILQSLIKTKNISYFNASPWYDIGNVDRLNEARSKLQNPELHVLEKLDENIFHKDKSIIKFFANKQIAINRVARTKYISHVVPRVTSHTDNFYRYDYVEGNLYSKIAKADNVRHLLDWSSDHLWRPIKTDNINTFKNICYNFYYTKTLDRLNSTIKNFGLKDEENIINSSSVPSAINLINKINIKDLCDTLPTNFHGDFILDNIIQTSENQFCLIDWRQDFGGELELGDMYYDLAKFSHNLVVNHEIVDKGNYEFTKNSDGSINVNIYRLHSLVDCEYEYFQWIKNKGLNLNKILILRALIWINMSPLHDRSFGVFLYYFGRYNLYNTLKKYRDI